MSEQYIKYLLDDAFMNQPFRILKVVCQEGNTYYLYCNEFVSVGCLRVISDITGDYYPFIFKSDLFEYDFMIQIQWFDE